jgi:hypothetical protein
MSTHTCPRKGCQARVLDVRFACYPDWTELSKPVRDAIWATAKLPILHADRRAAIQAAREEWNGALSAVVSDPILSTPTEGTKDDRPVLGRQDLPRKSYQPDA